MVLENPYDNLVKLMVQKLYILSPVQISLKSIQTFKNNSLRQGTAIVLTVHFIVYIIKINFIYARIFEMKNDYYYYYKFVFG